MMISVDKNRCTKCGRCIRRMQGFCISDQNGYPVFDAAVCNTCQKCVAICPAQAIMVNGTYPDKLVETGAMEPEKLYALFEKRRSIKQFLDKPVPKEILQKIVSVAGYAPNQNKNISILVVDDKELIRTIDEYANAFTRRFYRLLFGFKPLQAFFGLFYRDIKVIKRKMEYSLIEKKHTVIENTQAIIVLTGNKYVPVTASSAHYMLATIMYMAEALGIGNCLMDALMLTFNATKKLRKRFHITDPVLGVLVVGYSKEPIVNIPRGYEVNVQWNE